MKCEDCYLRYHCDEQTEWICKSNEYCKYIRQDKTAANIIDMLEDWKTIDPTRTICVIVPNAEIRVQLKDLKFFEHPTGLIVFEKE